MDDKNEVVVLEMTRDQALLVENACELLARLHIGQFKTVTDMVLPIHGMEIDDYCRRRDNANDALMLAAKIIFGRNCYDQPDVEKKDEEHNRAWNVYQVLRYTRSWHDYPDGVHWSVCFDQPMKLLNEPLPKCEIVERNATDGKTDKR